MKAHNEERENQASKNVGSSPPDKHFGLRDEGDAAHSGKTSKTSNKDPESDHGRADQEELARKGLDQQGHDDEDIEDLNSLLGKTKRTEGDNK